VIDNLKTDNAELSVLPLPKLAANDRYLMEARFVMGFATGGGTLEFQFDDYGEGELPMVSVGTHGGNVLLSVEEFREIAAWATRVATAMQSYNKDDGGEVRPC
jgi:hypothetical protein